MGMRGHHDGSFQIGHDLRDGKAFLFDGLPIEERYDLVVVGGGISGLAAAWFYRRAAGSKDKVLLKKGRTKSWKRKATLLVCVPG